MTGMPSDHSIDERRGSYLLTRKDAALRLRPVRLTDGPLLTEFFARLSPEDFRFRFLDSRTAPAEHDIAAMLEVDHQCSEHELAFDTRSGELVASVMVVSAPATETAEVAVAVASGWKHRGIGWALLRHAADLAFRRGIRTLRCLESRASHDALEVERTFGFRASVLQDETDVVLLEAQLD